MRSTRGLHFLLLVLQATSQEVQGTTTGRLTIGITTYRPQPTSTTEIACRASGGCPLVKRAIYRKRSKCWGSRVLDLRGGASSDDEADEEEDEDDDVEVSEEGDDDEVDEAENSGTKVEVKSSSSASDGSTVIDISKSIVSLTGRLALKILKVASRVVIAAFSSDVDDGGSTGREQEDVTVVTRLGRMVRRMWRAAWGVSELSTASATSGSGVSSKPTSSRTKAPSRRSQQGVPAPSQVDFGVYLSQAYGVDATRDDLDLDTVQPILSGTLSDALVAARSQARLLVVLIPASKHGKAKQTDEDALKAFLSAEVATVAEKRARKKDGNDNAPTGSFLLWSAKAGSAEAAAALKRLKASQTNSKGQKRPVLLVAYPQQVVDRGSPRVVPRLLAQHHCSPPPSPELMAAWLNALRKRHAKQYASMQLDLKEMQLHKDRRRGYEGSIQSDSERQERERREQIEAMEREKAALEREKAILERRKSLQDSLPEEPPPTTESFVTVALRFPDGRSSQRRFVSDAKLATVFNWVDAMFGIERELVTLTTLNGQKRFEWDEDDDVEMTLTEAGFGRMTGLRVTERKADGSSAT